MRIDIGSNSIRPELILNKSNIDSFEFNNRGENVRGRVIDVNQNMVLIQTSTGKEFVANTTIPMENFIGEEMLFTVLFNEEGQIFLKPQLDEKKQNLIKDLKVEDLLTKLGKTVNSENKEIVRQMIKSGIPVTIDSFKEVKDLSLSLKMLQNLQGELSAEQEDMPLDNIVRVFQDGKEATAVNKSSQQSALPKELGLKDIIILKSLNLEVNPKNLKAMANIEQKIADKDIDILDIKPLVIDNKNVQLNLNTKSEEGKALEASNIAPKAQEDLFKELAFKPKDDILGKDNALNKLSDKENDSIKMQQQPDLVDMVVKKLDLKTKLGSEDIKLDLNKIESELEKILASLEPGSKEATKLEKEIMPKLELLKDLSKNIFYQVVPFQIDKYENIAQYYMKKNKKSKTREEGITVAFSIETHKLGNVRAMLNYKDMNNISVNIATKSKEVEDKFKKAIPVLKERLNSIGFTGVLLSTEIQNVNDSQILDDVVYKNIDSKSFETWV